MDVGLEATTVDEVQIDAAVRCPASHPAHVFHARGSSCAAHLGPSTFRSRENRIITTVSELSSACTFLKSGAS